MILEAETHKNRGGEVSAKLTEKIEVDLINMMRGRRKHQLQMGSHRERRGRSEFQIIER